MCKQKQAPTRADTKYFSGFLMKKVKSRYQACLAVKIDQKTTKKKKHIYLKMEEEDLKIADTRAI